METLEELFRSEYVRLVNALSLSAGGREAATDAVQDAFLQADRHWQRIRRYDDPAKWVRRVAVNRLANQRRGERRRTAAVGRMAMRRVAEEPDRSAAIDVAGAIRQLPEQQRITIGLHYLRDLSVADVALAMGIAEGTVKSHLYDARRSLAQLLEVVDEP